MANVKISELTALTPPDAADLVPVTDSSASQTKRTTVGEIVGIVNGDVDVASDGTATISELPVYKLQDGDARQLLQTDAAGTGVEWTSDVDIPGTLGVTGQSTLASAAVSDLTSGRVVLAGTSGELEDSAALTFNGTQLDVDGNLVVSGDLTVEGASTILETETVTVEDKNIELGVVTSPTDVTADGGGITLKGSTDKTITWVDATDAWTSSERFSVPLGSDGAPSLTFTGDPNTGIYSPGADQVAISTNGTGRLFVDGSGNIGVNTFPSEILHVFDRDPVIRLEQNGGFPGAAGLKISAAGTNSSANASYVQVNGGSIWGQTSNLGLRFGPPDRSVAQMFLNTSTGSLLLGSSGAVTLNANGSGEFAGNIELTGPTQTTSTVQARRFATSSLGTNAEGKFQQNTGYAALRLGSDNTGTGGSRVGLNIEYDGSSVASVKYDGSIITQGGLYVENTAGANIKAIQTNQPSTVDFGRHIKLQVSDATAPNQKYAILNVTKDGVGTQNLHINTATTYNEGAFNVGGTVSAPNIELNTDGSAEFAGSVSIGGTAAANTIDEYEEGTWTPTFSFATAGTTTISYDNNTTDGTFGKYLKIGNIVYVWGKIKTTTFTFSGASGGARLNGLPYWATAPNESYGLNLQTYAGITGAPGDIIHLRSRGSGFFVFQRSEFGSSSVLDLGTAYFTSGTNLDLKFSGSYVTS